MTKRRDFIKKSVMGTAGITIGGMGLQFKIVCLNHWCK